MVYKDMDFKSICLYETCGSTYQLIQTNFNQPSQDELFRS